MTITDLENQGAHPDGPPVLEQRHVDALREAAAYTEYPPRKKALYELADVLRAQLAEIEQLCRRIGNWATRCDVIDAERDQLRQRVAEYEDAAKKQAVERYAPKIIYDDAGEPVAAMVLARRNGKWVDYLYAEAAIFQAKQLRQRVAEQAEEIELLQVQVKSWIDIGMKWRAQIDATSQPITAGEHVATLLCSDPYDERSGFWLSNEDSRRLESLPAGTRLFALPPA
jgi:hypothetical protein